MNKQLQKWGILVRKTSDGNNWGRGVGKKKSHIKAIVWREKAIVGRKKNK